MTHTTLALRLATPADLEAVDLLLRRSYLRLLAADYPPSVMVTAVPLIARARPELLASGRYWVALAEGGRVVGAGGYSLAAPGPRGAAALPGAVTDGVAHVRHVAVDPAHLRRGVARAILTAAMAAARGEGVARFDCLSTRTAVPFYASLGFRATGPAEISLAPGITFPAVRMLRHG
jgi:GNAT superfamily N-acetyltransferase